MNEAGKYYGKIVRVGMKQPAGGKPYMCIEYQVTHCAGQANYEKMDAIERDTRIYLGPNTINNPKAKKVVTAQLAALQFNGKFDAPRFADEFYSKGIHLICYHDPDAQGVLRERWKPALWKEGEGNADPAADAETISNLNSVFGGVTSPSPSDDAPPADDSGIPFS